MAQRLPGPRNMRLFKSSFDSSPEMRGAFREVEMTIDEMIEAVLAEIRLDMLRFLKGYTNVSAKGDYRAQFGPLFTGRKAPDRDKVEWKDFTKWWNIDRPKHPGGWADITLDLRNSYESEVRKNGDADYTLTLDNTSDHAKYVEAMAGLFVVEGVLDAGGYVHRSIEKAFAFISRRYETGPRGGRRLGSRTVRVETPVGNSVQVTGVP